MRCDLHVHTVHSGMCTAPVLDRFSRESYNDPKAVYEILKRRGMDLVTVTDHDSINASERLCRFPDFFLSEEVSCTLPSGTNAHVGVYDIDERDHIELQRRRDDFASLLAWLSERGLLFTINHAFSALTGRRLQEDFDLFASVFPGAEVLNGTMPADSNRRAACWAAANGKVGIAGSDSHTLRGLGKTYTEVRNARTKAEFLAGVTSRNSDCGRRVGVLLETHGGHPEHCRSDVHGEPRDVCAAAVDARRTGLHGGECLAGTHVRAALQCDAAGRRCGIR